MTTSASLYVLLILCLIGISFGNDDVQSVKVNVDGGVSQDDTKDVIDSKSKSQSKSATSLDKDLDPTERMEQRVEALFAQINELQSTVVKQQNVIKDLNETLSQFVFTSSEYGVIYDETDDRPLLMTSAHSHDVPFVMLNVISVRLPKKDAIYTDKKNRKKKGRGRSLTKKRGSKRTRYIHVIATLSRDGIFQLWDDEQNELYTYFDSNILLNNDINTEDEKMSDDELINANKNFIVYSDAVTETKYGNTWFVVARNDASWVKIYAIAAWRDYVNDQVNDKIRKSIISGHIVPENTIYRPTDKELTTLKKQAKKKKKPFRMSASKRNKQGRNKEKQDVNEFDDDNTESTKTKDKATNECKEDDKECLSKIAKSAEDTKEGEDQDETGQQEGGDGEEEQALEIKNATVSGVAVYQYQKKQYILVAYSDGKVFSYKPNGKLASSSSNIPYQAPNKTIVAISTTQKKYEFLVVTEVGFQFLKLPKLSKTGPFCMLPADTTVNSINFDAVSTTLMYLGTTDGRVIIYNTKKLNKKLCKSLDSFTVHPDSSLQIETLPGYLLVTSSQGLHVYNVTKRKAAQYGRPGLVFVKSFEEEFGSNDNRLSGSNVMVSSYTDNTQRTVIAYAQSATNISMEENENDKDVSYRFVVMESYLPSFKPDKLDKGGIMGIISKAPLFVGIAMFAFFWVFFKGKGGQSASFSNSPLGRLGKIFGGKRGRTSSRGGRDINAKMSRLQNKHGSSLGKSAPSKNARYTQQTARRSSSGRSGSSYRSTLGRRDLSD